MYAGTKVNWHEVLQRETTPVINNESLPLFLCLFSADKGTEEITDLVQKDFKAMYGDKADFFKYGQPLVQAHRILAAGGRVLGKRIVAEDATLANVVVMATVTDASAQKTQMVDGEAKPLYLDANGNETTEVTDNPATDKKAQIVYTTMTVENAKSLSDVQTAAAAAQTATTFPLFIIADNGRGKSSKNVRIVPDYDASKALPYMIYAIQDIEGTETVESCRFAFDPTAVNTVSGVTKNMSLVKSTCDQFNAETYAAGRDAFVAKIVEITGVEADVLYTNDIIFAKTTRKKNLDYLVVKEDETAPVVLNATTGMALLKGTNGAFGDNPWTGETCSDAWKEAAVKFVGGYAEDEMPYDPYEIYDVDQHKIDFCVDANYPVAVKEAIVALANQREDFYFFRDLGLEVKNIGDVQEIIGSEAWTKSPYAGDYISTYDVIDAYSKRQIKVTMLYGVAPLLVSHFATNIAAPIAGEYNNFAITDMIEGTLNIIPRVIPENIYHDAVDQKEELDNIKANFISFSSEGIYAVLSTYTSQDHWGPLSYASNVIVTQMLIKAIRRYCPKIRFILQDTDDFSSFKQKIDDNVISQYAKFFKSVELVYTADQQMANQKTFNGSIKCYYKDFPQGEIFDVFAIEGSPESNPY